jgi:hypothetical protein
VHRAIVLASLLTACDGASHDEASDHSDTAEKGSVVLIPAGNLDDSGFVPTAVRFGFVDERGQVPDPSTVKELGIKYDPAAGFDNSTVAIPLPEEPRPFLAYQLTMKRLNRNVGFEQPRKYLTETRYLDLGADTEGLWVDLPMFESITTDETFPPCFHIDVRNRFIGDGFVSQERVTLFGRVTEIFYGFTTATPEEYCGPGLAEGVSTCERNDVPFLDGSGQPGLEGVLAQVGGQTERMDEGGELLMSPDGSLRILPREGRNNHSLPIFIRVPEGQNLVYRLKLRKFADNCAGDDLGEVESDIFYRSGETSLLGPN